MGHRTLERKFIGLFEFSETLEDLCGKYSIRTFLFFKKNPHRQKNSFFKDGGLKLGHFDNFDKLFPFLVFVKL